MRLIGLLKFRSFLLAAIAINLALIGLRTASYRPLLAMGGGSNFVIEAVASLLAAGVLVVGVSSLLVDSETVLRPASLAGLGAGSLLVIHMVLELFGDRVGEDVRITLFFMAAVFAIWAGAGYFVARRTRQIISGVLAASWAAMTSVLIAVTFGLALTFFDVPRASYVATWPEFKESGWADPRAFGIANSFESAATHLLVALVLGLVMGVAGVCVARLVNSK